jgi:tRNA(Ile2) C34 agmatinyltransferase TiaS|tara:strand:- start:394 stop:525 length:132 start_codon:yes stop_codon:yes gene_type:complete
MAKCPYCGRSLSSTGAERICWFCEQDISKVANEEEKPDYKKKK